MKKCILYLIVGIVLPVISVGCGQQVPAPHGSTGEVAAISTQEPKLTLAPAGTPASNSTPPFTGIPSSGEPAPPYEEIKQNIDRIVKNDEGGPEMGDDGFVDPKMAEAYGNYTVPLFGKRAQDWHGWVSGYTQSDWENPARAYNLSLFMRQPKPGDKAHDGALLLDVPREQVEKLGLGIEPGERFDTLDSDWPRVVFSGTIVGVAHTGKVNLRDVTIKLVE